MRLGRRAGSGDVIDRRGSGGGSGLPFALGGGGAGSILILVVVLFLSQCVGGSGSGFDIGMPQFPGAVPANQDARVSSPEDPSGAFVEDVLADVQDTWAEIFAGSGESYSRAKLVLFSSATTSGCGAASSATGPFYCPTDRFVYLDTSFFDELHRRFGAPGDFAQAYVIAHEIGHHVQTVTGVSEQVQQESRRRPDEANQLSVRLELQADCYAGVWGHSAANRGLLDPGDLEEALTAAAAIGDDRIQRESGAKVNQDTWTHGSSEQRQHWFKRGFDSGDPNRCDTFSSDI
jgi:predicted metalloprotease